MKVCQDKAIPHQARHSPSPASIFRPQEDAPLPSCFGSHVLLSHVHHELLLLFKNTPSVFRPLKSSASSDPEHPSKSKLVHSGLESSAPGHTARDVGTLKASTTSELAVGWREACTRRPLPHPQSSTERSRVITVESYGFSEGLQVRLYRGASFCRRRSARGHYSQSWGSSRVPGRRSFPTQEAD